MSLLTHLMVTNPLPVLILQSVVYSTLYCNIDVRKIAYIGTMFLK